MAFDGYDGEDVYHSVSFGGAKDVHFSYSAGWPLCELVYQSSVTRGSTNIAFCYYTYFCNGLRYCDSMMQSQDCFGCISLRRAKNCILNKAYSVHEYDKITSQLIGLMRETGEWGEFFPPQLSTFGYNNSAAQDYFPLVREQAVAEGWNWLDENDAKPGRAAENAPRSFPADSADIAAKVFKCEDSGKPYKVVRQEIEFYRKMNLPVPHMSPDSRHRLRFGHRNPHQIYRRLSDVSQTEVYSSYAPDWPERICSEIEFQKILF